MHQVVKGASPKFKFITRCKIQIMEELIMLEAKCKKYWKRLGIISMEALKEHIKTIFEKHDHQEKVLIDLYRMVFPDWDQIKKIKGHPETSHYLWSYICILFQEFDSKNHPGCLPGGAWMNWGFSVNKELPLLKISFDNCSVSLEQPVTGGT
jgi:hypothetical protein